MSEAALIKKVLSDINNPTPKGELFPYRYYDEGNNLFVNLGSVGFCLEMKPLVGISDDTIEQLSLIFDEFLPANSFLQFMMIGSDDISLLTDNWLGQFEDSSELSKSIAHRRIEYLKTLTKKGEGAFRVKDWRVIVNFAQDIQYSKKAALNVSNFRSQLEALLKSCGIVIKHLGVQEFLELATYIISPQSKAAPYNPYNELCSQIAVGTPLVFDNNKLTHGDGYTSKFYIFEQTPKDHSLAGMINLLGDSSRDNLQIPGRLILNYTVSNDLAENKQVLLKDKGKNLIDQANSYLIKFDISAKKEIEEWKGIVREIDEGRRFLTTSFMIMLTDIEENFSKSEQYLISLYAINSFRLKSLSYFVKPSFELCLPFGPSGGLLGIHKKYGFAKTTTSQEPLAFLPIHGEWKGNSTKGVLMTGRLGQPFIVDLFSSQSNYNAVVIGESGSGKSVLLQEVANTFYAQGAQVFILDIGRSYEKLCKLLGGDFVEFKMDSKICLNPFSSAKLTTQEEEDDFLSLVTPIISKMAAPKRGTTDIEDAIISSCVKEAWLEFGQDTSINSVIEKLKQEGSDEASNLSKMLFQYSDKGPYGRFFNGKANIDFTNSFTVIEFEELRERHDLLSVVMQIFNVQIMNKIFTGKRERKSIILMDECWLPLELHPKSLDSINKTIRKYNGSLLLGTQSVNHFYCNDSAKSILDNAAWLFMLQQKPESIDLLKESKRLSFDEGQMALMKTVKNYPGKYSECLISSSSGYVVGRLILDPFSRMLYTTSANEFSAVQNLIKSGLSVSEAVSTIVRKVYG